MTEILNELLKVQKNALLFWLMPITAIMMVALILTDIDENYTNMVIILTSIAVFWLLIGFIRAIYFFFKWTFYLKR